MVRCGRAAGKRRLLLRVCWSLKCGWKKEAHHCSNRGVLHGDIKPKNLLINDDTLVVKLIDFGCENLRRYESFL
ncbi:hypothetical protein QTP86_032023 [Hemibagrus guttatus]|nr:hypothetical protein QTP86_032023 [Hemibagrus guttatus]